MNKQEELARIGALIKARRREGDLGLRAAAEESHISPSTLSRLERGDATSLPDAATLTNLAAWLNMPISALLGEDSTIDDLHSPELSTPEQVEVHLRADKNLSPQTAKGLANMFRLLYDQLLEIEQQSGDES